MHFRSPRDTLRDSYTGGTWGEGEMIGDRQDPNDAELEIRVSINVQTTSTKLAGNVPDLPLTFPVHLGVQLIE